MAEVEAWKRLAARLHLVHGWTVEEVAVELGVSFERVRYHLDGSYRKRKKYNDRWYRKRNAHEIKLKRIAREEKKEGERNEVASTDRIG